MEAINNNDNAPTIRSTINNNFSSMGSGFQEIYASDNAPTFIGKVNHNFEVAEQGGGGSGETVVVNGAINVKTHYNAVGDGVADDTAALEAAFAAAFNNNVPVYIPTGTYLIRRPLTLRSGMEIYGDGDTSIIKKKAAVWHQLTVKSGVDKTTVTLDSVEGLSVGDAFYISSTDQVGYVFGNEGARDCTYGKITAISGNNVTFESYLNHSSGHYGTVKDHNIGCYFSTSFAILRSWSKYACIDVEIHHLKFDGNWQSGGSRGEPCCWCNSVIHFDPYSSSRLNVVYDQHTYNHFIHDCTIVNSSCDAISDQGEGGLFVSNCTITRPRMHGVHTGTVFSGALVQSCNMVGFGSTKIGTSQISSTGVGVFWCQGVTDMVIVNNTIISFNKGCSDKEYGTAGKYSIIHNNKFEGILNYVFDFSKDSETQHDSGMSIIGNEIKLLNNTMFYGVSLKNVVISGNEVKSFGSFNLSTMALIAITNSQNVLVTSNVIPSSVTTPVNSNNTENIINASNSWNV